MKYVGCRHTLLPLQPKPKLEILDDLLAQAEHYAGFCMRNSGKLSPTLFLISTDGPLMFGGTPDDHTSAKEWVSLFMHEAVNL